MRSHESPLLIDRNILHTLNMVQNFNVLKNVKKKSGECLVFKDHSIVSADSTHFRNICDFVWKIILHEFIFKHSTYIECKEGEEYHSMIIECSLIDRKASKTENYAFKMPPKKSSSKNKITTCELSQLYNLFVCFFLVGQNLKGRWKKLLSTEFLMNEN